MVAQERLALALDRLHEQPHQPLDLLGRALPVLDRERVERQVPDAHLDGGLGDDAHADDALVVAEDAVLPALLRPPPVAVHDDGDVAGDRPGGAQFGDVGRDVIGRHSLGSGRADGGGIGRRRSGQRRGGGGGRVHRRG